MNEQPKLVVADTPQRYLEMCSDPTLSPPHSGKGRGSASGGSRRGPVFGIVVSEQEEYSERDGHSGPEMNKSYRVNPKFIKNISIKLEKYTQMKMNEKLNSMRHSKGSMKLSKVDSPDRLGGGHKSQFAQDDLDDMKSVLSAIQKVGSDPELSQNLGVINEIYQKMQIDVKIAGIDAVSVMSTTPLTKSKNSQNTQGVHSGGNLEKNRLDMTPYRSPRRNLSVTGNGKSDFMREVRKSVYRGTPVISVGKTSIENFDGRIQNITPAPNHRDAGARDSSPQYNIDSRIRSSQLFIFFLIG